MHTPPAPQNLTTTPTPIITHSPLSTPTNSPTQIPTYSPSQIPTYYPSQSPTQISTNLSSQLATNSLTYLPTTTNTKSPSPLDTSLVEGMYTNQNSTHELLNNTSNKINILNNNVLIIGIAISSIISIIILIKFKKNKKVKLEKHNEECIIDIENIYKTHLDKLNNSSINNTNISSQCTVPLYLNKRYKHTCKIKKNIILGNCPKSKQKKNLNIGNEIKNAKLPYNTKKLPPPLPPRTINHTEYPIKSKPSCINANNHKIIIPPPHILIPAVKRRRAKIRRKRRIYDSSSSSSSSSSCEEETD